MHTSPKRSSSVVFLCALLILSSCASRCGTQPAADVPPPSTENAEQPLLAVPEAPRLQERPAMGAAQVKTALERLEMQSFCEEEGANAGRCRVVSFNIENGDAFPINAAVQTQGWLFVAVGRSVFRFDGHIWVEDGREFPETISSLDARDANHVLAGGTNGNLYRFDGSTWRDAEGSVLAIASISHDEQGYDAKTVSGSHVRWLFDAPRPEAETPPSEDYVGSPEFVSNVLRVQRERDSVRVFFTGASEELLFERSFVPSTRTLDRDPGSERCALPFVSAMTAEGTSLALLLGNRVIRDEASLLQPKFLGRLPAGNCRVRNTNKIVCESTIGLGGGLRFLYDGAYTFAPGVGRSATEEFQCRSGAVAGVLPAPVFVQTQSRDLSVLSLSRLETRCQRFTQAGYAPGPGSWDPCASPVLPTQYDPGSEVFAFSIFRNRDQDTDEQRRDLRVKVDGTLIEGRATTLRAPFVPFGSRLPEDLFPSPAYFVDAERGPKQAFVELGRRSLVILQVVAQPPARNPLGKITLTLLDPRSGRTEVLWDAPAQVNACSEDAPCRPQSRADFSSLGAFLSPDSSKLLLRVGFESYEFNHDDLALTVALPSTWTVLLRGEQPPQ